MVPQLQNKYSQPEKTTDRLLWIQPQTISNRINEIRKQPIFYIIVQANWRKLNILI